MGIGTEAALVSLVQGTHEKDGLATKEWPGLFVKSIDEEKRQITAVASSDDIDRDDEIVETAALKAALPGFMRNPVVLACHQHRLADGRSPVVGTVVDAKAGAHSLTVRIEFADTPLGLEYWALYKGKYQKALSIGFRVIGEREEVRKGKRIKIITALELYEISCVPVPANAAALSKSREGKRQFVEAKRRERELAEEREAEEWVKDMFASDEYKAMLAEMEDEDDPFGMDDEKFLGLADDPDSSGEYLAAMVKSPASFEDENKQGDDLVSLVRGRKL
jgi:HK97 family phage prohead protease